METENEAIPSGTRSYLIYFFGSRRGAANTIPFNNAAERALRGFALGRKAWLFAGFDRGADRAAFMATLIMSAKLNDIDPPAWLADVLARIADTSITRLEQLLPWNWQPPKSRQHQAA